MTIYQAGGLVRSLAGHDKDQYFIILTESGEYVTLVNGTSRKLENPKRKNKKHIQLTHNIDEAINRKQVNGEPVTDEEIRFFIRSSERNKRNHRGI